MKDEAYEKNFLFEENYFWFVARNRIVLEMVKRYVGTSGLKILDFGCGTGKMLELMKEFGDVQGCDMSELALDYCRRRGMTNLIQYKGSMNDLETYDLITVLDMLEHVDDDKEIVSELNKHLNPGGKLVVAVPALPCLWSGEDYVSDHKRRYVKKQLISTLEGSGMKILRLSYFNTILLLPIFINIKLRALIDPESMKHSNLQEIPKWINSILTFIFSLEIPLLRFMNLPPGMSLICIAEKQD